MFNFLDAFEHRRESMFVYHYYFAVLFTGIGAGLGLYLENFLEKAHSYWVDAAVAVVAIGWAYAVVMWTHQVDRFVRFDLPKKLHGYIHETPYYTHEWLIYVYETRFAWCVLGIFSGFMLSANIYFYSENISPSPEHPMYMLVYCFWFFTFFLALFSQRRMLITLDSFREAIAKKQYDDKPDSEVESLSGTE